MFFLTKLCKFSWFWPISKYFPRKPLSQIKSNVGESSFKIMFDSHTIYPRLLLLPKKIINCFICLILHCLLSKWVQIYHAAAWNDNLFFFKDTKRHTFLYGKHAKNSKQSLKKKKKKISKHSKILDRADFDGSVWFLGRADFDEYVSETAIL